MTGGKIVTKEVFVSRVEEMIPVLYRVCRAHFSLPQDREDAVQEALVRAWEKRDTLRDERYMQTWLIRILLNVCNGIHRKRRRAERAALPPPQAAPAGGADALREALMALPLRLRLPVVLYYMEGMTQQECARALGWPASLVKSRLRAARAAFRKLLEGEEEAE